MEAKMNLIILGGPGSGKGTQAVKITKRYGIPAISTGDIFRDNIANGTELGMRAKSFMDRGELVPDDIVIATAVHRIGRDDCKGGFLFDGFPRTTAQAEALDMRLAAVGKAVDKVILIDVPADEIMRRIAGRYVCEICGVSYHVPYIPPAMVSVCDICGGELSRRIDDDVETVKNRIEVYNAHATPLIEYYSAKNLIAHIVGTTGPDVVFADIVEALDK
jgi:adenylate kinase